GERSRDLAAVARRLQPSVREHRHVRGRRVPSRTTRGGPRSAADDVGNDDRGGVDWSKPPLERGHLASSWRVMGYVPMRAHCVDPYFANRSTLASTKWLFCSISWRDSSLPV